MQRIFEYGNKNGRLLAWLARGPVGSTYIARIRDAHGVLLSSPEDISSRFYTFFQEVNTSRTRFTPSELQEYLGNIPFPVLSDAHRTQLEAIGCLQGGKTPGADGLPTEFYSQHMELLAPRVTTLSSGLADMDTLPESMEEAIIILIPKPGKDPQECASYRPISLLNVDSKILAKILATRLSSVISM